MRSVICILMLVASASCLKTEDPSPDAIPAIINGIVTEFNLMPINGLTPDKGTMIVASGNTAYKVDFTSVPQAQSDGYLSFESDTVLISESREFTNLGEDAISYRPIYQNEVTVSFNDGRKISGIFYFGTAFGGVFGRQLIAQWRDPSEPTKPTQKAIDDIRNLVRIYSDSDGPGPDTPLYLSITVSRL